MTTKEELQDLQRIERIMEEQRIKPLTEEDMNNLKQEIKNKRRTQPK